MIFFQKTYLLGKMAMRTVFRQRRRSIIVGATAMVSVFTVVMSQGFMNGFFVSMVTVAIESGLGHVQIRKKGYLDSRQAGEPLPRPEELEKKFQSRLPADVSYAPRMELEGMLRTGADVRGILLMGVDPVREGHVSTIPKWIVSGSFFKDPGDRRGNGDKQKFSSTTIPPCIIGEKNARDLGVELHDGVVLSTGSADGGTVSFRCQVEGIFKGSVSTMEEAFVFMRRSDLSAIRNNGDTSETDYFVFLGPGYNAADPIMKNLEQSLQNTAGVEVDTFQQMEPAVKSLFDFTDQFMWIFYFIIMIGFAIILFESVTMSIFERTHEIGIIHAIGTRPSFLFWMVILESFFLTAAGVLIGIALGSIIIFGMFQVGIDFGGLSMGSQTIGSGVGRVYPYVTFPNLLQAFTLSIFVSVLSGIYPAFAAVRISPVRAIYNR